MFQYNLVMSLGMGSIQEKTTSDLFMDLPENILWLALEFPFFWGFRLSVPRGNPGDGCDLKILFPSAQRMDVANFPLREDKIKGN